MEFDTKKIWGGKNVEKDLYVIQNVAGNLLTSCIFLGMCIGAYLICVICLDHRSMLNKL